MLQDWLRRAGFTPIQIYPGSPWENGYNERYGRIVAVCVLPDGRNVGAVMVSSGLALDYAQYSKDMYAAAENEARQAGRGMWAGEFVKPWGWRRNQ